MRIPIIEGRGLEDRDDASITMRVVVSQSLARALFGASRPAGRSLWVAALGRMAEVVGVVGDVKHRALDERTLPTLYVSAWQAPSPTSRFVIRSSRGAQDTVSTLRAEVARFDPELPVYGVRPMASLVESSPGMPARRVMTACFAAFAALALVVAGIGLFGVVAHDLASRRFELALRVALGADPSQLQRSIAGHAAKVIVTGVIPGLLLSAGASRLLRSALTDIDTADPLAFAAVAAVLLLVAVLAIAGPVRRVARTDPALVLRGE